MANDTRERGSARELLLDAAEALMRDEGYAAVTSRRVAAKAGLKPQLVHYHFRTMDDLFLDVFRRLANEIVQRHEAVEQSPQPLRDMWNILTDSRYRLLIHEFVALGNHRRPVQSAFIQFGDQIRQLQVRAMARVLADHGVYDFPWSPAFAAILLHSLARFLALEAELGVSEGHAEAIKVVDFYIGQLDRPSPLLARVAELETELGRLRAQLASASIPPGS
jgi:AcrR family transcriptional regulator